MCGQNLRQSRSRFRIRGPCEVMGQMMSAVKAEAIRLIESLPEHCSLEDIQYHLYIIQKVRRGLTEIDEGRFVPQEEAERRISGWGRSTGQNPLSTT